MLRKIASIVAGVSMLASSAAFAADTNTNTEDSALAPGNAAGIHQAQAMEFGWTMAIVTTALVAATVVVLVTSSGNGGHSTTGTTPPG